MRICIIGKFPPIQGGVSSRSYWTAHGLAVRGHEVHVVTNAKEVRPPFRMYMRPQDWDQCEGVYDKGSVKVHWTDAVDSSQSYIPMTSPFVSKLAGLAARVHSDFPFDVLYSHYLEPYGVAGHLAAQITGLPHVVRMAGSDAGRLWHHPQFEALYDHVLRSAEIVIAAGPTAERARARGVAPDRIASIGGLALPEDLFSPDTPTLDLAALRTEVSSNSEFCDLQWGELDDGRPHFGIYGKLGDSKGSFALLEALHRLKQDGLAVGLVAMAHGGRAVDDNFRKLASDLQLADRILQIPFLPHWRVPGLLRGCIAVCCLEQDFPIMFHTPLVQREVLLCGTCLVGSAQLIRKLPDTAAMVHGYNCVAIEDGNDIARLSAQLSAIVQEPEPAAAVGQRGRDAALAMQREMQPLPALERILEAAIARQRVPPAMRWSADEQITEADRFPLTQMARRALNERQHPGSSADASASEIDRPEACELLKTIERCLADGDEGLQRLLLPVITEIAIATATDEADAASPPGAADPLFRLRARRWAMAKGDLSSLVPVRSRSLRILEFDFNVTDFMAAQSAAEFAAASVGHQSYIVVFGRSGDKRRSPLLIDGLSARILELSDGTRTSEEIVRQIEAQDSKFTLHDRLNWVEDLFARDLLRLQDARLERGAMPGGVVRKISAADTESAKSSH